MITAILFYIFAAILLASAAMVVSSRNPVHSVLFLILAFFNAAALFLIAGAEFLAMILVIVYVGAVAVLFLFVVMMLDVDFAELRSGFQRYLPIGATVGVVLLLELAMVLGGWELAPGSMQLRMSPTPAGMSNTEAIGPDSLHRLHLPVPDRRPDPAGRDDRRDRADVARPQDLAAPEHPPSDGADGGGDTANGVGEAWCRDDGIGRDSAAEGGGAGAVAEEAADAGGHGHGH